MLSILNDILERYKKNKQNITKLVNIGFYLGDKIICLKKKKKSKKKAFCIM